jgi:simple sugar transport system ATP-binding protein
MLAPNPDAIAIDGVAAGRLGPRERRALGSCFVPEERNGHGAVRDMSLSENAFLSGNVRQALSRNGLINSGKTSGFAGDVIKSFDVRTTGPAAEARSLSGGNLQKFIVGREVRQSPSVLVVSQPTWGVDAGAAAAIHQALIDLAANGAAVLVISQDLDELLTLTDRLAVINQGVLSRPLLTHEASVEEIGLLMGGLHGLEQEPPPLRASTVHVA